MPLTELIVNRMKGLRTEDRETDCLIHEMLHPKLTPKMRGTYYGEYTGEYFGPDENGVEGLRSRAKDYTASQDTAMALVRSFYPEAAVHLFIFTSSTTCRLYPTEDHDGIKASRTTAPLALIDALMQALNETADA